MSIYVKHKIRLQIAKDSNFKTLRHQDSDTDSEVLLTAHDRDGGYGFTIAESPAEEAIVFGDVANVKGVYIEADQNIGLKINGSASAIMLAKGSTATGTLAKFFIEGTITSLTLVGASGATATGYIVFWGADS